MDELSRNQILKRNYYALLLAVAKSVSAKDALIEWELVPNMWTKEEMQMNKFKGYSVPDGYMGYVKGKYQLFETEMAYYDYMLTEEEV